MVVRITELKAKLETEEPRVRFVPRKKRKADINLPSATLKNENNDIGKDTDKGLNSDTNIKDTKHLDSKSSVNASEATSSHTNTSIGVSLPTWRLEKEAELQKEEKSEPITQTKKSPTQWINKKRTEMTDRDWRIMRTDLQIRSSVPIMPLLRWDELSNPQLVRQLLGKFSTPMPVQRASIGIACFGGASALDLVAIAPTGSGKTLGFVVPIVEQKIPESLVLAPTRELALQIAEVAKSFGLRVISLIGGHDFAEQAKQLDQDQLQQQKQFPRIIVATPGRLLDFISQKLINISHCSYLVFDEADRMIDLGFEPQISEIMQHIPTKRQTMMFSATWPPSVRDLSAKFLRPDYIKIDVSGVDRESSRIKQSIELVTPEEKMSKLIALLKQSRPTIICFVATKVTAEFVAAQITESGIPCQFLHGGLSQSVRDSTLTALRNRRIKCLVATDVASRGVDVQGVSLVINYDLPQSAEIYVHRIGRTGRAGEKGKAISFATEADKALFPDLKRLIRESGSPVPAFLSFAS